MNAAPAPTLPPGSDFAGYRVERRIGAGGAGETYLVRNPGLDRAECLKLLNRASGPAAIAEARTVARLGHPGTVTVFNNGAAGGHVWYTMPFAPGGDLGRYLDLLPDDGSRLREAMPMLGDIAQTIDDLHQRPTPVMHGDIKPSNILVDTSTPHRPRALLSDFGSSLAGGAAAGPGPTGSFGATPPYLSPGRRFGRPPSAPDDRYAFACTAFEALTGHRPFRVDLPSDATARTRIEAWRRAHLAPRRPVPSDHDPALAALDPVFRRALAIEEAERHPTAGEFHRELHRALYGDPAAAAARRSRRRTTVLAAAVTILALALAGAGWAAFAPRGIKVGGGCPDASAITGGRNFTLLGNYAVADLPLPSLDALPAHCRYSFDPPAGSQLRRGQAKVLVFNSRDEATREARGEILARLPRRTGREDPEEEKRLVVPKGTWAGAMPKGTPPVHITLYPDHRGGEWADTWSSCVAATEDGTLTLVEIHEGHPGSATGVGGTASGTELMCEANLKLLQLWQTAG